MIIECNVKSFYAFIDKEACTKILSNLLSNAIKYARSKIIVRFEAQDGERFTIDIMNDGKPISEEIKEKIFEPFYRDDSSIHKSGTGLGLPLARSLAEMHEGSLTLEESPAGLIIFRLRLPVNQPNSLKLEEEKAEVLTNPASERKYVTQESRPTVLVVEDNTEMLHFIGQEINVHYNVVTAGNGEEAIANIKSMAYTKADEKFLKKLNDIIDSHINDVNLDVDMIADLMNLSRPTLYRKINGLSNVTPNELIKISRLKKAAELILQGDMRIYEIAEAVGFNSQSYFSRAFSKQFNMSPSQYAKENNIELK
ncbi:ATP-binding protein [Parabacteroides distasonis]